MERSMAPSHCRAKYYPVEPPTWLRNWRLHPRRIRKQWMVCYSGISWNHMATGRIFAVHKTWRSHRRRIFLRRCLITIWCTNSSRCHKRWTFRIQKHQWIKQGRSSKSCQRGIWKKTREIFSKKDVILGAQRDRKKVHFCHTDGHMSPQQCGVGTPTQRELNMSLVWEKTFTHKQ